MKYSFIPRQNEPTPVPERSPNGGLYTGELAVGSWGNIPVAPESHILTTENLLSANPPPGAIQQSVSTTRPGNNEVVHPFHTTVPGFNGWVLP